MERRMKMSPNYLVVILGVVLLSVLSGTDVFAGCQINVYVKNTGKESLNIKNRDFAGGDSSVKIKLGTWRSLGGAGWFGDEEKFSLDSGQKNGDGLQVEFNCGAKRRYKV